MSLLRTCPVRIAGSITIAAGLLIAAPTAMAQGAFGETNAPSTEAIASDSVSFNIQAQDLSSALIEFGRQSGQELLYSRRDTDGLQANGVFGRWSRATAMEMLLEGTGLEFEVTANGGMLIADRAALDARLAEMEALRTRGIDALPSAEAASVASSAGAASIAADGVPRYSGIEEVIVTGQKREERIQDVPIAISAFSMDALDAQKIEGGFDLLKAVPNVTFSKSNFTGYNFQIRGIGTQAISATTDPGVAVSFNNTTLIVNRLFEQEYLDIERLEVLRGPQGTLYGRNATAGVINVISAKPQIGVLSGEYKLELGNYNARRARGHINFPLGENVAVRAAVGLTQRDGYGTNLAAGQAFAGREAVEGEIDDRDLWTGRLSLAWAPNDRFKANVIYERFEENDRRMRSTKQLCHHDNGEVNLYDSQGNVIGLRDAVSHHNQLNQRNNYEINYRGQFTQGCLPGSLFSEGDPTSNSPDSHGAFGTPNANAIPFVRAGRGSSFFIGPSGSGNPLYPQLPFPSNEDCTYGRALISECVADPLAIVGGQSRDLRSIFSLLNPRYEALSELAEMSFDYELTDGITLSSQTVYMENKLFSTQDFLRFQSLPMFGDSRNAAGTTASGEGAWMSLVTPHGIFTDPQLGPSDRLLMQDVSQQDTRQLSQEIRAVSNFDGPINFSMGANYTRFENTADYFVFINTLSALVRGGSVYAGVPSTVGQRYGLWGSNNTGSGLTVGCGTYFADLEMDPSGSGKGVATCIHVQPGSIDDIVNNPQGHQFFMSRNPFQLNSASLFGEVYFDLSDNLKVTAGVRLNWDRKTFTPVPSQTMLADWRGRLEGGTVFNAPGILGSGMSMAQWCDPRVNGGIFSLPGGSNNFGQVPCALGGLAENGRGYPQLPDIVQEWRVPTGRIGFDWKPMVNADWIDESLVYFFYTRGYKAGGANPPTQSAPSGLLLAAAQGAAAPPVFEAEYVNAFEIGVKNRLFNGGMTLNASAFYYDYSDYQVSKIVDRSASNENFDATLWGVELEALFAVSESTLINASVGYLRTRIGDGEYSLDLMDRTQGGNNVFVDPTWAEVDCDMPANSQHAACIYPNGFDQWVLIKPTLTQSSNCVAPAVLVYEALQSLTSMGNEGLSVFCPGGTLLPDTGAPMPLGYSPFTSSPNGAAGFLADISGNELPNAPRFTIAVGLQHTLYFPKSEWSATARFDWYWQDKSFHRVYNTNYDRLKAWSNSTASLWFANERTGFDVEVYIKNVFDETPITGAFLNSDDTGLSTNVFTLDPRLIGLSIRKRF